MVNSFSMDGPGMAMPDNDNAARARPIRRRIDPRGDRELAAVAKTDNTAFEEIMRRNNRRLFRAAHAILRDHGEAEDAVQEAYVRAYRHLGDFQGRSSLATWLVKIAVNEALDRKRRRNNLVLPYGGSLEDLEMTDNQGKISPVDRSGGALRSNDPESTAARSEIRHVLEAAIEGLPQDFRAVFVLRALEEFSTDDTAECLDIPAQTVKTRYFRAKRLLRNSLNRQMESILSEAFPFAGKRCDRIVLKVFTRLKLPPPA